VRQKTPQSRDASLLGWDWTELLKPADRYKPVDIRGGLSRTRFFTELNRNRDVHQFTFKLRPGASLGNALHSHSATISASAQLRLYVDEWLDTGVDPQGVEDPRARDMTKALNAATAVRRFASKQGLRLEPARDGLILEFPSELGNDRIASPEPPIDVADRLFSLFLLCKWRPKLAKCRRLDCGRYFELKHWNRAYKRGTWCPKCQPVRSQEAAVLSTCKARKQAESELYRRAAKQLGERIAKQPNWYRDLTLKAEVIDFLNEQIANGDSLLSVYRHSLTGKWLSRSKNRDGIERAAKEKIHAKS
jgi:hypothetical protein